MENQFLIEQDQETRSSGLREIVTVLFKYKVAILAVFIATTLIVAVVAMMMPTTYDAKSSILVKKGREYLNRPEVGDTNDAMSVNMADIINAEIQMLKSRDLAEKVVKTLQVSTLYPDLAQKNGALEKAVDIFQKNLLVESVKNSSVIQVSFQHTDPKTAANAVNTLVELLKEKHLQVFSEPRSSFLEQQLATYEQQLKESEKNFEGYKQKNRVFSLEEQRTLLLQQRMSLDSTLKDAQDRVAELGNKLATLTRQNRLVVNDKSLSSDNESGGAVAEAKSKLLALQLEEQQLLKKYNENSRMVVNARKEIDVVKSFLRNQEGDSELKAKSGNPVVQQVRMELMKTEADLNSQRARVAAVSGQLAQIESKVQSLDRSAQQFQSLKRELATTEKNYQTYLNKAEEARLSEDMNRQKLANLSVLQPATPPSEPFSRKKLKIVILGVLAGGVVAVGGAFLFENLLQTVSDPAIAEKRLGLPVLASLPYRE